MTVIDIILKKRNGKELSTEEISYIIKNYVDGTIPDYQMSALLMAVWFNGMNSRETADLTKTMMLSGDVIDLSGIAGSKADKHSTGGVADTTTLITAPLAAACGVKVAKMSGRGLGHTGGTLDKLESIPGFSVNQTMDFFIKTVSECGVSVIGQSGNLVPADKMLYSLRDVTGTVDNISLIASSIMSKKLAAGTDVIVLDVKTGSGAFMKKIEDAEALAREMVSIGSLMGKHTTAIVSDMSQPLGNAIGNALEVQEAIEILSGFHKGDLLEVSLELAARMVAGTNLADNLKEAREMVETALDDRRGLEKMRELIQAQGGDPAVCDDITKLPRAEKTVRIESVSDGYITSMDTAEIGMSALLLGAGRQRKTDEIDPAVGIWMKKRLGDKVTAGEVLAEFHVNRDDNLEESVMRFQSAVKTGPERIAPPVLIRNSISCN